MLSLTRVSPKESVTPESKMTYAYCAELMDKLGIANVKEDVIQRIVFNIYIGNTDDHLRNHGFILTNEGWRLSPAYDINPSIDKDGLALNIDMGNNILDIELARSVGTYFRLGEKEMDVILDEVKSVVCGWQRLADHIGIPRSEQILMSAAFKI